MRRLWQRDADDGDAVVESSSAGDSTEDGDASVMEWDGIDTASSSSLITAPDVLPVDEVMTHVKAAAVKFPLQEPRGYAFPHVEQFVKDVSAALQSWADAVHSRDLRAHALERELELRQHDINRLRTEMELFRVQGDAVVTSDGSYLMTSQVEDVASVTVDPVGSEALAAAQASADAAAADAAAAHSAAVAAAAECDQWRAVAEANAQSVAQFEAHVSALNQHVEELTAVIAAQGAALREADTAVTTPPPHKSVWAEHPATVVDLAVSSEELATVAGERDQLAHQVDELRRENAELVAAVDHAQMRVGELEQQWTPQVSDQFDDVVLRGPTIASTGALVTSHRDPLQVWLPPAAVGEPVADEVTDPLFIPQPQFRLTGPRS